MNQICLMKNKIQNYAWGSRTAIAGLLDQPVPSSRPEAEMWMGAHHKAASQVRCHERWQALDHLIDQQPLEMLGRRVCEALGKKLPFLFKVLAADKPLSIQAHPDKSQALAGFQRENLAGTALDAPHRNYKDEQHKPECLCALTPFLGLCGFRTTTDIAALLGSVWPPAYNRALTLLSKEGVQSFFSYIMKRPRKQRIELVEQVRQQVVKSDSPDDAYVWVDRLAQSYGRDIGVLSPLILNFVELAPGQAIYLPAGQLHAYLNGVGIELMANSDNVLRGGLTSKHVDVPELLNVLDFSPYRPEILNAKAHGSVERSYPSQAAEFMLSVVQVTSDRPCSLKNRQEAPEILLCTEGRTRLHWQTGEKTLDLPKGQSAFVPACVTNYSVSGDATIYRATINL